VLVQFFKIITVIDVDRVAICFLIRRLAGTKINQQAQKQAER
jgi:hypothetical protein